MRYQLSLPRLSLRLFALGALLCLCLASFGCGSSSEPSSAEVARQERESARDAREERKSQAVKRELESGDFVDCGGQVFANKQSLCTFAKNVKNAYYVEVVAGTGKAVGLHPPAGKDFRVLCTGTVPHRCTGFKDDGGGIEPLKGGLIFFSP